jgi:hypothetical protein
MASITRKIGSSGKLSPYWRAKFRGIDGRTVWLTTKCRDSRKALAIAGRWEKAARLAADWELNQSKAQKILDEVTELVRTPATLAITKELLDGLLRDSIGGSLAGQNFQQFAPHAFSKLTAALTKKLCATLAADSISIETACRLNGICKETFYNWYDRGKAEPESPYGAFTREVD